MDATTPPYPDAEYSDDELRLGMELLFYAYRDFVGPPDEILKEFDYGRAHHRVIHFVGRDPGMTVSKLLGVLRITKQSLSRVLSQLIRDGIIDQATGARDRRQRLLSLTRKGRDFEFRVSQNQRDRIARSFAAAGPEAVAGFRKVMIGMIADPADADKFE